MLLDRNYWATYQDPLILWFGRLPSPAELGIDRVFAFAHSILATAEREQVMHVIESHKPWLFKQEGRKTWLDFVRERFDQKGEVRLFPGGGWPTNQPTGRLRIPARLAYYKYDHVVEENVEDPGLLLQNLQCPDPRYDGTIGRYSTTPLALNGDTAQEQDRAPGKSPREPLLVSLGLPTDIWFPRVVGPFADDQETGEPHPARGRDGMMDNSALAARHTPRLNRFIETLRDAVLELGGTWTFDPKETHSRYLPMVHHGGINLDNSTANA